MKGTGGSEGLFCGDPYPYPLLTPSKTPGGDPDPCNALSLLLRGFAVPQLELHGDMPREHGEQIGCLIYLHQDFVGQVEAALLVRRN